MTILSAILDYEAGAYIAPKLRDDSLSYYKTSGTVDPETHSKKPYIFLSIINSHTIYLHNTVATYGGAAWGHPPAISFMPIVTLQHRDLLPMATGAGWPEVMSAMSEVARSANMPNEMIGRAWHAANFLAVNGVMLMPEVGDPADGDLTLLWKKPTGEASLVFEADGTVLGYAYRYGENSAWNLETQSFSIERLTPLVDLLNLL